MAITYKKNLNFVARLAIHF